MNKRVFSLLSVLFSTCLLTNAQKPAQPAESLPDIYETSVREPVKTKASWQLVESRNFRLGQMTSDAKRLWAVRKFTNSIYVFDSEKKTWTYVGHAKWVVGITYAKSKLWVATQKNLLGRVDLSHNLLWTCDLVSGKVSLVPDATESATENPTDDLYKCWKQAGEAEEVVAMTSDGERLWYADSGGDLWVGDASETIKIEWKKVDTAENITAMTFGGGTLWATNTSNKLLVRDPVLKATGWRVVDDAYQVMGLAWLDGKLWGVSSSVKSIHTELSGKGCTPIKSTSEVSSEWTCPGIPGYKLQIQSDDDRDSVNVITPDGKGHPLNFSKTISKGAFASLGPKAEWRVVSRNGKDVPIALIVRVDLQTADSDKRTSYLAVSRITAQSICVTDRVNPGVNANGTARSLADSSVSKPCL